LLNIGKASLPLSAMRTKIPSDPVDPLKKARFRPKFIKINIDTSRAYLMLNSLMRKKKQKAGPS
jgi:hypothetical protein